MNLKEFFYKWSEGIQKITPLQLTFQQIIGQIIILCGIVVGLITSFIYKQWWIFTILIGSIIVTGTSFIGVLQKYSILKKFLLPIQQ